MPRRIAVVTIHGINTAATGYSEPFKKNFIGEFPKELRAAVSFREVYWADILRGRQDDYMNRVAAEGLKRTRLRDLVVRALGDAAAYQKTRRHSNSAYYDIQGRVLAQLKDLEGSGGDDPIIVIVAHSLGCHIASSFAWDVNKWKHMADEEVNLEPDPELRELIRSIRSGSAIRRLDTFGGLLTLGSNMPLFTFTFGPERVFPITKSSVAGWAPAFPGRGLDDVTKARAKWINIYSTADPLGYPLKPLNEAYRLEPRIEDQQMNVEGLGWPFTRPYRAHVNYWKSRKVARSAAGLVASLLA